MARRLTAGEKLTRGGIGPAAERGLGEMPLTLWVIAAGVILYLYIRRANLGIDTHPGEGKAVMVQPKQPSVFIGPRQPVPLVGPNAPPPSAIENWIGGWLHRFNPYGGATATMGPDIPGEHK